MKATKMRNRQMYRASLRTKSRQLGSPLSKGLREKYGRRSVRVVRGDSVRVVRGEYIEVSGKVSKVSTATSSIAIEGIKKEKSQGEKFDVLIHTSNVVVTDLNTEDSWRMSKLGGTERRVSAEDQDEGAPEDGAVDAAESHPDGERGSDGPGDAGSRAEMRGAEDAPQGHGPEGETRAEDAEPDADREELKGQRGA